MSAAHVGFSTRDEDLRDAMNPREVHHRLSDVGSFQDPGLDLQTAREIEVPFQALAFRARSSPRKSGVLDTYTARQSA